MSVDEKIIALAKTEYIESIPSFLRKHAAERICKQIETSCPEIYGKFTAEEPSVKTVDQMTKLVNDIFEERIRSHHLSAAK